MEVKERRENKGMGRERRYEKILALLFFSRNPPPCQGVGQTTAVLVDRLVDPPLGGRNILSKPRRHRRSLEQDTYRQRLRDHIIVSLTFLFYHHFFFGFLFE